MFVQYPILSRTVLEEEEAKFSEVRESLEPDSEGNYTIDTGTRGTEETYMNFHDPKELKYDSKEPTPPPSRAVYSVPVCARHCGSCV